jgi:hypothetical protein
MSVTAEECTYRPTEAKYKGGAQVMYITYDLEQATRGGGRALFPKVKRVYIPGKVLDWHVGDFKLRKPNRPGPTHGRPPHHTAVHQSCGDSGRGPERSAP